MPDDEDDLCLQPPCIPQSFPRWAPASAVDQLRSIGGIYSTRDRQRAVALLTDARMAEVWQWYALASRNARLQQSNDDATKKVLHDESVFLNVIMKSCGLPSFPGNLSPSQREQYFASIREHAASLIELLKETPFGGSVAAVRREPKQIAPEDATGIIQGELDAWTPEMTGHGVTFWLSPDGVSVLPHHYPESSLCGLLRTVIDWTHQDDGWDWSSRSSKPMDRTKGRGAMATYFARVLYCSMRDRGIAVPFNHLATIANVALALPQPEELDEDSARKKVRRYLKSMKPDE